MVVLSNWVFTVLKRHRRQIQRVPASFSWTSWKWEVEPHWSHVSRVAAGSMPIRGMVKSARRMVAWSFSKWLRWISGVFYLLGCYQLRQGFPRQRTVPGRLGFRGGFESFGRPDSRAIL